MDEDEALLPISALSHLIFCERRAALIHIEGLWSENRFTVEGAHMHAKAHEGPDETRHGVRIARALPLRSGRLGLVGKADIVEFHPPPLPGGAPQPFPVEYKRGRPKPDQSDVVQLCAQAMCLEEMLGVDVPSGALFYGRTRRRLDVRFDTELRRLTEQTARRLHELIESGRTPRAVRQPKCDGCSLLQLCLPDAMRPRLSATQFIERSLTESLAGTGIEDDW